MRARLVVLQILVISLLAVLAVRLWQVQVMRGPEFVEAATETRTRAVVVPAVRGQILDSAGRPLVRNRTALVVSVDRTRLVRLNDRGEAVLRRLSAVLKEPVAHLRQRLRSCGPGVTRPCWPGSPYQPIPIHDDVSTRQALQILERQEEFPGVTAEIQAVREYPWGSSAAQVLGYLQPITQQELDRRKGLGKGAFSGVDVMGRDGLESVYDEALRGTPGLRRVAVDRLGKAIGVEQQVAPVPGDTLITSIDAKVQHIVERALADAMKSAPRADGAAGVVLDPRNGRVLALASAPSYNPAIWTGGISEKEYTALLSGSKGKPLVSRAIKGEFAPGSTFKISSVAAMLRDGYPLNGKYDCPGSFMVGNRPFNNFRGIGLGVLTLHTALVKSCDTIFYRAAYEQWQRDGGIKPKPTAKEPMAAMARAFGFGTRTGIDLPGESSGRIPGRAWKEELWTATKDTSCKRAKTGYPEVEKESPSRAAFLKRLAYENCLEGNQWRAGDAANFSIGQGDVLVTPLQLASAYAALVTDGQVRSPRVGWALMRPDGKLVRRIEPPVRGKLPLSRKERVYIKNALSEVPSDGTAAGAFGGWPMDQVRIGGKTGTAEVYGKEDTAWFASFAPTNNPKFVVVVMISQGGMGGSSAAPAVRKIYEGIFGLGAQPAAPAQPGAAPVPARAALPDRRPATRLPLIKPDGTVGE
ncbi:penicillin-binding protein 2 [Microtetraspora sp. NBRC 13810]|uniref:penicillin-binding protein 2 n=1 Tax=Microtetraspora sp. NBRC 13810 TaxID=3030990 RepID=UPI00331A6D89